MAGRTFGVLLLALFLLLYGLLAITNFRFEMENFVMGAIAIVAAVLLVWGK